MRLLWLFFVAASNLAIAQVPQPALLWLQGIGGSSDDQTASFVVKDQDGGFIVGIGTNSTAGTGNIDSFCSAGGGGDIYTKYSASGAYQWSKCLAPGGIAFPLSSGNFIYGSDTSLPAGFAFLFGKENGAGVVLWSKTFGNNADAILESMTTTDDGNYVMIGETNYADTDFIVHYGGWTDADIAVIKLDSNGNKLWARVIGGTSNESAASVVASVNGGCFVIGVTASNDLDCTGNHGSDSGTYDLYLARLDGSGNLVWHKDLGGSGTDAGKFGWPDGKGGLIVCGATNSHDGDVTHYAGGVWLVDVDSNGTITWNNTYGNNGAESPNAVCKATDGSIWVAAVSGSAGGQIGAAYGNNDAWFIHVDSTGNFINAKVLGSDGDDRGEMIYPLSNGSVIAGGFYSDSGGTFHIPFYGESDAFIAVFDPQTTNVKELLPDNGTMNIFPNPAGDLVTVSTDATGSYTISVTDIMGKEVYHNSFTGTLQIPVSNWTSGLYIAQITGNSLVATRKILIR